MKNNILNIVFSFIFLVSCITERSGDDTGMLAGARSLMAIEVLADGADEHDYIHTARFIVFDNASVSPVLDINELIAFDAEEQDAKKFSTTLEVSSHSDKMLVVVVNEPTAMTASLDAVISRTELEDMIFHMDDVFNPNHSKPSSSGIPMTGVKRNIVVAEGLATREEINIERGVARVELWLKKEDAVSFARVTSSTKVSLENSYAEGYLVVGTETDKTRFQTGADADDNFGRMLIPDNDYAFVGWNYAGATPLELDDTYQLIVAFYTPERTCSSSGDTDKLILNIEGVSAPDGAREGRAVLSSFSPEGGGASQVLTEIRRNNIYRIMAVVKEKTVEFEHRVLPWKDAGQGIIIDPQYYLRVNHDKRYINDNAQSATITAETNYDRSDRGYPKGIQLGIIDYYDKNGGEASGGESDWLNLSMSGANGDLSRNVIFTASRSLTGIPAGAYALVEVKAGNLIKKIKIIRS